jgi:hypothetical protein
LALGFQQPLLFPERRAALPATRLSLMAQIEAMAVRMRKCCGVKKFRVGMFAINDAQYLCLPSVWGPLISDKAGRIVYNVAGVQRGISYDFGNAA